MFSIFIMLSCLVTQADAAALSLAYCYTDTSENSRWYKLLLVFATPSYRQQRRDVQVLLFSCNFRNDPTLLHYQFRLCPCLLLTWTSECVVNVLFLCCHRKMQKVIKLTCSIQNKTSYFVQSKNYSRLIIYYLFSFFFTTKSFDLVQNVWKVKFKNEM